MPLREYVCRNCRIKIECLEYGDPCCHACIDCGETMDQVEYSRPAWFKPGKFGKGSGGESRQESGE